MARPLRIEYEGAYYHVFSRGNKKQAVFRTHGDRRTFLNTLARMAERFDVSIFAYVLMDNHYHLLMRTNRPNLSKSMHWLGTTYTTLFNLSNVQTGHLFQGRFKSLLVENETYLLQLSYYIHRNPLRAGLVNRLVDYPWSSYPVYAYNRRAPSWLQTSLILSQFGSDADVHSRYREKVQNYAKEQNNPLEDIKHGVICGSRDFVDRIKQDYLSKTDLNDVPDQKRILNDIDADEFIRTASRLMGVDVEKWKKSRRIGNPDLVERDMLLYFMWECGKFKNDEIGAQVGLTSSSISRRVGVFQAKLDSDKSLQNSYRQFKTIIKV